MILRSPYPDAAAFSPASLSGLQLWLDADDAASLTLVSGAVSQWGDKSGKANHATQGTAAARPTVLANILNGKPVVRFDGSDDSLSLATAGALAITRNKPGVTLIALHRLTASYISGTGRPVIYMSIGTSDRARAVLVRSFSFANGAATGGRRLDADAYQEADSGTNHGMSWLLQVGLFDHVNATATNVINGTTSGVKNPFQTAGNTSDTSSQVATIAAQGTVYTACDIAEILVYDRVLSASERQQLEQHLSQKWAITLT